MIQLIKYFFNSCLVTVLDVVIVWVLHILFGINIVYANTIGVVVGFLVDYRLSSHFVFEEANGVAGFIIYFGTFLFGLVLADGLIYLGESYLFSQFEENLSFLMSKGLSIGLPFFILYFIRKFSYDWIGKNSEARE